MPDASDWVFYDGECGLCHGAVRWILLHDRCGAFAFAPIGGPTFERIVPDAWKRELPDSLVVVRGENEVLIRSSAVTYLLERLGRPWRTLGRALALVPRTAADRIYDGIAARRRRWSRKPADVCPAVPPELARRFHR